MHKILKAEYIFTKHEEMVYTEVPHMESEIRHQVYVRLKYAIHEVS